ncbi:MAG TPA: ATP-grasp domain-containing protein [Jatrophihabitans sp.]|nr:ATP-grasp domain-containing protein [Jatrophihabitans sp.]
MKLLVGYDGGAVGPMEIVAGLRGLAEPVFLVPEAFQQDQLGQVVSALAETISFADSAGEGRLTAEELDRIAAAEAIAGALTFSEKMLPAISAVTTRLQLPGHAPETVRPLTDKYAQRCALRDSGVDSIRFLLLENVDALDQQLIESVGFPAILKPVRGSGSRNTYLVTGIDQLTELARALLLPSEPGAEPAERRLLLEQYLTGDSQHRHGDYVSVESLVHQGEAQHLAVTGKFRQLSNFREVGDFWPAMLSPQATADVERLVSAALGALGVRTGFTHTEVKLTSGGPHIIEVNGRLGGDVHALARAAYGIDVVAMAGRNALGLPVELPSRTLSRVFYNVSAIAPLSARRLRVMSGAGAVRRLPTVASYRRYLGAGGSTVGAEAACALDLVTGWATDHEKLPSAIRRVTSELNYEFDWYDGTIVTRNGWQLTLGGEPG